MKKIGCILPEIFNVFTFSMQPIFHLQKEVVQQPNVMLLIFRRAQVPLS